MVGLAGLKNGSSVDDVLAAFERDGGVVIEDFL